MSATIGVQPTPDPAVVIAIRETSTPAEVTLHALNARTGAELSSLGRLCAGPISSWPGRSEVVFVATGELKAFDYVTNSTRVVGCLEGAGFALGFDPLGTVMLAARVTEPFDGTYTVADGRLTSAMRPIPVSSSFGRAMGLVRIKL